jgi:hypothetical protein
MKEALSKISALLEQAANILSSKGQLSLEESLGLVDKYVGDFDSCRKELEQIAASEKYETAEPSVQQNFKMKITELNALHQDIIVYAGELKEIIVSEMADVHQKTKIVKNYLDRYPATISLTGKKKG